MVKRIFAAAAAGALALALASCGQNVYLENLVPWYAPYVKSTVDLSAQIAPGHQNDDVVVARLVGPKTVQPSLDWTAYIVVVQYRIPPEPNLVMIFNDNFKLEYSYYDANVANPASWYIDEMGYLNLSASAKYVVPPGGANQYWSIAVGTHPANAIVGIDTIGVAHAIGFSYASSNGIAFTSGSQYYYSDLGSKSETAATLSLNILDPVADPATSITFAHLFDGTASSTASAYSRNFYLLSAASNVVCPAGSSTYDLAFAIKTDSGMASPPFVIRVNGSNISSPITPYAKLSFDMGGQAWTNQGGDLKRGFLSCVNVGSSGYVLTSPADYGNKRYHYLHMFHDSGTDGSLLARLDLRLPYVPSSTGNSTGDLAGVSQRPYHLNGREDFVVYDGYNRRLAICRPWWR